MSTLLRLLACAALLSALAPSRALAADGEPIDVRIGWEGRFRPGRWVPVFVTLAAEPATRSAVLELEVPRGGPDAMRVRQPVVLGTQETTVVVHVPLVSTDRPTVTLRDANTGKAIARWPAAEAPDDPARWRQVLDPNVRFAGVTGVVSRLNGLRSAAGEKLSAGYLEPALLPETPIGYDLLDLLVLYKADVARIAPVQQRAMADWVLAGGVLLVIPSDEPMPSEGAVAELLPCRVGPVKDFAFDAGQLAASGLKQKFATISGFDLRPADGVTPLPLLGLGGDATSEAIGYTRRAGFGRVVVAPIDVATLEFDDPAKALLMVTRLLGRAGMLFGGDPPSAAQAFATDAVGRRQAAATAALTRPAADVPAAGGSTSIALWLAAMALVVGPVDWVVLKLLGRRPWTVSTVAGLVGLVVAGGMYATRSVGGGGDVEFRSVEVIDQADGRTVARTALATIGSSRSAAHELTDAAGKSGPLGWWEPASPRLDAGFRQSGAGSAPEPLRVDAGGRAHLLGRSYVAGDPLIEADLQLSFGPDGAAASIQGRLTNRSGTELTGVRVRVHNAFLQSPGAQPTAAAGTGVPSVREWATLAGSPIAVASLKPGESVMVGGTLKLVDLPPITPMKVGEVAAVADRDVWAIATELAADRAWRAEVECANPETATVYATVVDAEPSAVVAGPIATRRHDVVVRALVAVKVAR